LPVDVVVLGRVVSLVCVVVDPVVVDPVPHVSTWLIAWVWPWSFVNGLNTVPWVALLSVNVVSPPLPLAFSLAALTRIVPVNGASAVQVAEYGPPGELSKTNVSVAPPITATLVVRPPLGESMRVAV